MFEIKTWLPAAETLYSAHTPTFCMCLERAVTDNVDLAHADLRGQNLADGRFAQARLHNANLSNSILQGANFDNAVLSQSLGWQTYARYVSLRDARLSEATWDHADFEAACLAGTDCTDAGFRYSTFSRADLSGANFSNAGLYGALIGGARWDVPAAMFAAEQLSHYRNVALAFCSLEPQAAALIYEYVYAHRQSISERTDADRSAYDFPQLYTILQAHVPQYITQIEVDRCWRRLTLELPELCDWWNMFRSNNHGFPARSWAATHTLAWFSRALRPVIAEPASARAVVTPARRNLMLDRKEA